MDQVNPQGTAVHQYHLPTNDVIRLILMPALPCEINLESKLAFNNLIGSARTSTEWQGSETL